ncbi:MAG: hypothetical protein ACXV8U_22070 [Methylobacter sp.]
MNTSVVSQPIDVQQPTFSFTNRILSAQLMGVSEQNGKTMLTPSSINSVNNGYQSPYQLSFNYSWSDLVSGLAQTSFTEWQQEGNPNYFKNIPQDWFDPSIYKENASNWQQVGSLSWGPGPGHYPQPTPSSDVTNSTEWRLQRLVAVAASMIGYGYLHHHIPDWNPGQDWYTAFNIAPTDQLVGQGLDCSDYTSWLHNYGLGIYLDTDVANQGAMVPGTKLGATATIANNSNPSFTVTRIADASMDYETLCQTLQTGDLLYIAGGVAESKTAIQNALAANQADPGAPSTPLPAITHVIMWLGNASISNGSIPLVTDSHGGEVMDENGVLVPTGIQVRPFNNSGSGSNPNIPTPETSPSWYFDHFLWALRIS